MNARHPCAVVGSSIAGRFLILVGGLLASATAKSSSSRGAVFRWMGRVGCLTGCGTWPVHASCVRVGSCVLISGLIEARGGRCPRLKDGPLKTVGLSCGDAIPPLPGATCPSRGLFGPRWIGDRLWGLIDVPSGWQFRAWCSRLSWDEVEWGPVEWQVPCPLGVPRRAGSFALCRPPPRGLPGPALRAGAWLIDCMGIYDFAVLFEKLGLDCCLYFLGGRLGVSLVGGGCRRVTSYTNC